MQSLQTECTASALQTKGSLQELHGSVSDVRAAVARVLEVLSPSLLSRDQQRCCRETFTCYICRGNYVTELSNLSFIDITLCSWKLFLHFLLLVVLDFFHDKSVKHTICDQLGIWKTDTFRFCR